MLTLPQMRWRRFRELQDSPIEPPFDPDSHSSRLQVNESPEAAKIRTAERQGLTPESHTESRRLRSISEGALC